MKDFEQGIIVTLSQESHKSLTIVPQKLCLFYLSKNIHRHAQELGLLVVESGFLKVCRASHSFSKVYMRILVFT